MKKKIAILGSTGSIGKSTIEIIKKDKKNFDIILLTTHKNLTEISKQVKLLKVKNIIITDKKSFNLFKNNRKNKNLNIFNNYNSLNKILKEKLDYTMSAITGLAGLDPTLKLISKTKTIAIANKESLICAWNLIYKELKKNKTEFIPVDSEHFSIWSLIGKNNSDNIKRVYITASGGPFLNYKLNQFKKIKIRDALKHPSWAMGKKITIDSATMMNKVFEVIETNRLFKIDYKKISILTHNKSYLHAIIEFNYGLIKFLVHETDMKIPIFNSIYDSKKSIHKIKNLNLDFMNDLNLREIDIKKFPVIKILRNYPKQNTLFDTVLVSINDILVELFLSKKISFLEISKNLIKFCKIKEFQKYKKITPKSMDEIYKLSKYVSLKIHSKCI